MTRRPQGIALITVLVVLVALALIATPFALSMRGLESSSLLGFEQEAARADAQAALAAATHHLAETVPMLDTTPHVDDLAEIAPDDLSTRYPTLLPRNPQGTVASVQIEDEQGKVDLATATPWLLGNLLGGRTRLSADVAATGDVLAVEGTEGFLPTGIAWVGHELVEYGAVAASELREARRGLASPSLISSHAETHRAGDELLDLRLLLLAEHGWRARPGEFSGFSRVDGLKEIGTYGELSYTAEDLRRARPWLTVHSGEPQFSARQRVLGSTAGRDGLPELLVADGSHCGPGAVLQLRAADGATEWLLVTGATDWGESWHLSLLEPPALRLEGAEIARLVRTPVNVDTAPIEVLVALLEGLGRTPVADVITDAEAGRIADALVHLDVDTRGESVISALRPLVDSGICSELDVRAALAELDARHQRASELSADDLRTLLVGVTARQEPRRLGHGVAQALAMRLRAARPASHEDLRAFLDGAVADGTLDAVQRDNVLRDALDPDDAQLCGGTAPFTYASRGVFSVRAAASRNQSNGKESARATIDEIVAPAPEGETAHTIDSQRDFADATELPVAGWSSFPETLCALAPTGAVPAPANATVAPADAGAGGAADPVAAAATAAAAGRLATAFGLRGVPDRAGALLGGRPGAALDGPSGYAAPSPVRSALPDTLHFDELSAGLCGSSPRGWNTADGALQLPLDALKPRLVDGEDLLGSFDVEFWFELSDLDAESVLLDAGLSETEDRVLIDYTDHQLVLRVDDTGIKDFEAKMPKGRAPPSGEIRYAFDDGLSLRAGVPYHVLAQIGGARDRDLALFVDGVPRGHRSFTTALSADVLANAGGGGPAGYNAETKLKVESTAGFPERGALRVGDEIMEYTGKEDGAFLVRSAGSNDPFGGRGRRDTVAVDHPASESVELVGWTRPLASSEASRGNGTLASPLGRWAIAELDPSRLTDTITMTVTTTAAGTLPYSLTLGTGLTFKNTTLPVRATGSVPLDKDSFSAAGGYAIVFCDYGVNAVSGLTVTDPQNPGATVTLGAKTDGGWLGGAECVRYAGYDGTQLTGVSRNSAGIPVAVGGKPSPLLGGDAQASVRGGSVAFKDPREFVTTFDPALTSAPISFPQYPRVLVVPISVGINGGDLFKGFHPNSNPDAKGVVLPDAGPLVQLDLDFPDGDGGTEWVRWDTATAGVLVRDNLIALNKVFVRLINDHIWDPKQSTVSQDTLKEINQDLRFRGQDGTQDRKHPAGATALPTLLMGGWHIDQWDAVSGLPGRNDGVTLVSPDGRKEWHRVNWAWTNDPDWSSRFGVVGLRDAVSATFVRTDPTSDANYAIKDLQLDKVFHNDDKGRLTVRELNADARLLTRLVCSPSGELPSGPLTAFHVGEDWSGRRTAGAAVIDELRFHAPVGAGPMLPDNGRCLLVEDLKYDEDSQLRLGVEDLLFPHTRRHEIVLGADALEVLGQWPQAGGLLRVGEEILGYAGIDPADTGHVFITARGLYGTARAFHRRNEPVVPLTAWPAAPLAGALNETAARIPLADASAFPARGLLLVGEELLGYEGKEGNDLLMPVKSGGGLLVQEGLLRGRFGTVPAPHAAGAMVRWMPERVRDRALLGQDAPESEALPLCVRAPGAAFTELVVTARLPDASVGLDLRVVPDGLVSPHVDPATDRRVLAFDDGGQAGEVKLGGPLFRQADRLDVWCFAHWRPGAFDARTFASSGWKLAPEIESVVVGHVQPTLVYEHEERR